ALSMQTSQFLQSVETALAVLALRLADIALDPRPVAALLEEMRPKLPPYLDFGVFDAEGRGVAATVGGFSVGRTFADRDYFRAHRERSDLGVYFAEPIIGRSSQTPILPVSLRLNDRHGQFRGVLLASVYTRHLAEAYAHFPLGDNGLIVLVRTAPVQIIARSPDHDRWFAQPAATVPLFAGIARGEAAGQIEGSGIDGILRLASWQRLDDRPLALVVGIARADLEAGQRTERLALIGGGLLATVLVLLLAWRTDSAFAAQRRLAAAREADARALAEIADTLKRAQAVAQVGSWHLDLARNRLDWSDETYRIFGVTSGQPLTYEDFLACVHPEDRAAVDAAWQAALKGAPYDIIHRIVVGGETKWVREQAELKFDAQGR
ncbi:MAG: PAS domain-containing protein, partial [Rhodocyclaceae bacterium]|nr:PAS domain-containing protein [Rhodocyclaceae bacterium]